MSGSVRRLMIATARPNESWARRLLIVVEQRPGAGLAARDCAADAFAGGRAGEIPGYRPATNVLRFRADELEAWLETRRS